MPSYTVTTTITTSINAKNEAEAEERADQIDRWATDGIANSSERWKADIDTVEHEVEEDS